MQLRRIVATGAALGLTAVALTAGTAGASTPRHPAPPKPTVVLVHGAWADGSSWAAVTTALQERGYTVDVVPNPLRGVKSDADYLARYLRTISGPIVLAGHSYGGMVITNAATGNPNVTALVYVDAFIPDQGETVNGLSAGSALNDQSNFSTPVPLDDGNTVFDLYIRPDRFAGLFLGGGRAKAAAVLAAGQRPLPTSALGEPSPYEPAWTTIPSYALIGTADRIIPRANQLEMTARAHARVVKVDAPHLSMVTDPRDVTDLIVRAATHG
jgi:pimeloyl-ACP methyl ester carboxylesterase